MNNKDEYLTVNQASLLYGQEARYKIWAYTGYVKKTGSITGRVILGMENGHIKNVELIDERNSIDSRLEYTLDRVINSQFINSYISRFGAKIIARGYARLFFKEKLIEVKEELDKLPLIEADYIKSDSDGQYFSGKRVKEIVVSKDKVKQIINSIINNE